MEGQVVSLQEVFSFRQMMIDAEGKVRGRFRFNGIKPKFMDRLEIAGIKYADDLFSSEHMLDV